MSLAWFAVPCSLTVPNCWLCSHHVSHQQCPPKPGALTFHISYSHISFAISQHPKVKASKSSLAIFSVFHQLLSLPSEWCPGLMPTKAEWCWGNAVFLTPMESTVRGVFIWVFTSSTKRTLYTLRLGKYWITFAHCLNFLLVINHKPWRNDIIFAKATFFNSLKLSLSCASLLSFWKRSPCLEISQII